MKKIVIFIGGLIFFVMSAHLYSKSNEEIALKEIEQLIESFRLAILNKDEEKFISLFYNNTAPLLSVNTKSGASKLPALDGVRPMNYINIMKSIVSNKEAWEQKISDTKIFTDGDVASVQFKYSSHLKEQKFRWGFQSWQVIRTADGWKINSAIYSSTYNKDVKNQNTIEPISNTDTDKKEITQIIEDFKNAIVDKDMKKFNALFYDKSIPWIGISREDRKGSLPSQDGVQYGNQISFIASIVNDKKKNEEKFWNETLLINEGTAIVHFKYSFHEENYKTNWGDEAWQLIKTGNGWKINSVIYSIIRNPQPIK